MLCDLNMDMIKKKTLLQQPAVALAALIILYVLVSLALLDGKETNCGHRVGDTYVLCKSQIKRFRRDGLAIIENMLTEEEVSGIEEVYDLYMREGSPEKQGRDFCDMSQPFDTPRDQYKVINAMLPRKYYPELQGNVYERVGASIAAQLFPTHFNMTIDYDQLLDKTPHATGAVFAWHQDMAYWPPPSMTPQTDTVTFSLALDSTNERNGCIRYVPGSGRTKQLRPHAPLGSSRSESHAVVVDVAADEVSGLIYEC